MDLSVGGKTIEKETEKRRDGVFADVKDIFSALHQRDLLVGKYERSTHFVYKMERLNLEILYMQQFLTEIKG